MLLAQREREARDRGYKLSIMFRAVAATVARDRGSDSSLPNPKPTNLNKTERELKELELRISEPPVRRKRCNF